MLHSAPPPRAYLVPLAMGGFSFDNYYRGTTLIGGTDHHHHHHQPIFQSYADAVVDYADQLPPPAPSLSPQETNPYARLAWTNSSNCSSSSSSTTPPPLDLSIKPTGNGDPWQPIEVDCRAEATTHQRHYAPAPEEDNDEEDEVVVDDDDDDDELNSQRSCSSAHSSSAQHQRQHASPIMGAISHQEAERLRVAQEMGVAGYSSTDLLLSPSSHHKQQSHYHQLLQRTPPPHHHLQGTHALTPPSTPSPPQPQCSGKRSKSSSSSSSLVASPGTTPVAAGKPARAKKKHARKLKFDEDKSSPVSGTVIIGEDEAALSGELEGECADIDPSLNIVNVSPEARAKLAKIENKLGPYQCMLCRQLHEDAFQLAQHRCSRIRNVDYRCPECDKRFTCPANLASHRRWHKPKPRGADEGALSCTRCEAKFAKPVALRKHVASHHPPADSTEPNNNNSQVDKVVLPPSPSGNAAPTMEVA
ncbi:zinc finger protein 853-like [Copidosoma floridanum]|uniref:zinc finger protein 853-like n=1 Tax=Copidosoma floridanum TaxID=29053 RepID=UPI0006C9D1F9|nr:zinc finger protein 853-like [Copidosoma floridanum]